MTTKDDIYAQIESVRQYVNTSLDNLKASISELEEGGGDGDTGPITATFTITSSKTLAHFVHGFNNAPKKLGGPFPIMMIYPSEVIIDGRIKFLEGDTVPVYPTRVKADGGTFFYKIAQELVAGTVLYLRSSDGVLIE